jgi:uncharacterized protein with PQ loop repeat
MSTSAKSDSYASDGTIAAEKPHYVASLKEVLGLERLAYVAAILTPIFAVPQLLEIWISRDVSGVSLATWIAFLALSTFWAIYSVVHRAKPLMVMYIPQVTLQVFIVYGIIIFR